MSVRGLELRLKRLEQRRKKSNQAPTRAEFDDAAFRDRVSNVYSAKLKLYRMSGREDELWQKLSDYDRRVLENDTPEQRALDEDVVRRYEKANGIGEEKTADYAAKVKAKDNGQDKEARLARRAGGSAPARHNPLILSFGCDSAYQNLYFFFFPRTH